MELNARIFVAGHRGMVGSAIVRKLTELGYTNIITIAKINSKSIWKNSSILKKTILKKNDIAIAIPNLLSMLRFEFFIVLS